LIANSYVLKSLYLIIQEISLFWDEIKILFNMVAIMKSKEIILRGVEVAGDLTIRSRQKWTSLQNKYRLEDRANDLI
jgi:hypothetical protein